MYMHVYIYTFMYRLTHQLPQGNIKNKAGSKRYEQESNRGKLQRAI